MTTPEKVGWILVTVLAVLGAIGEALTRRRNARRRRAAAAPPRHAPFAPKVVHMDRDLP